MLAVRTLVISVEALLASDRDNVNPGIFHAAVEDGCGSGGSAWCR